jgi:hypothetical protein
MSDQQEENEAPAAPEAPSEEAANALLSAAEAQDIALGEEEENEPEADPEPVSYSGTDFDVEGLVRRLDRRDIVIPTFGAQDKSIETAGFQRSFVWRRPQMDRFIESLLLGYPVPGIILVQQLDRRYLVLDGQQRLRTLASFYEGVHDGVVFSLANVARRFKGLTYKTLGPEEKRTLDNTFIPATVVKTDGSDSSLEAVYQIFERLNSGGTQLTPHEIRVALYAGPFIEFLSSLNNLQPWRDLYGLVSPRLRDQEVVLRFMALYSSPGEYKRPLKKYLNDFTARHRYLDGLSTEVVKARFEQASALLGSSGGRAALRTRGGAVNAALTEALLVGLARRLDLGVPPTTQSVAEAVRAIVEDPDLDAAISRSTADEESVRTRLAIATKAFATI